jgi:hypothetical protein
MMPPVDLSDNLQRVREEITAAAQRAGRAPDEVSLVAVSKTRPPEMVSAALAAGVADFGENYAQEMAAKAAVLQNQADLLRWHYIGHLQRNKVRDILSFTALLHTVDSLRLAEEVNRRAGDMGRRQPVLLQVDLAGEATKYGCPEDQLPALVEQVLALPHLDWQGLMTMPPLAPDPEATRPYYRRLAALSECLAGEGVARDHLRHLSMGLSHDFPVAVEEGATLVRIGTAIFGPRPSSSAGA